VNEDDPEQVAAVEQVDNPGDWQAFSIFGNVFQDNSKSTDQPQWSDTWVGTVSFAPRSASIGKTSKLHRGTEALLACSDGQK
jgi:hypothetical protein